MQGSLLCIQRSDPIEIFLPSEELFLTPEKASAYFYGSIKAHATSSPLNVRDLSELKNNISDRFIDWDTATTAFSRHGIDSYDFDYVDGYVQKFADLPLDYIWRSFPLNKAISDDFEDPLTEFLSMFQREFDAYDLESQFDWDLISLWWKNHQKKSSRYRSNWAIKRAPTLKKRGIPGSLNTSSPLRLGWTP